ncbi:MAG: DeoR/GlpR family DNA-binding transcription regulator [Actinomycetaceae bacterium]|nr:DeoR/GlpR family DNA-binding transcription regulator [Actinomycetaceae bacterium]
MTVAEPKGLDPRARQRFIMDLLVRDGATHVDNLAHLLRVSAMTIYRDVAELERSQLVVRHRGEVRAASSSLTEAAARVRISTNEQTKAKLAAKVRTFLARGQSVLVDDSSSNLALLDDLEEFAPITIITNAEFIATKVRHREGVRLILVGGEYEAWADSYFGHCAETVINQLKADLCVMSATALTPTYCYHPNQDVARVKRAMIANSTKKILVVDSSKFRRSALHKVGPVTDFDIVITDENTPAAIATAIEEQGVTVIKV